MGGVTVLHADFPASTSYPTARPARVLADHGYDVRVLDGRADGPAELDGVPVDRAPTVRGMAAVLLRRRPDLLLLESPATQLALAPLAPTWVRSPVLSASPAKAAVQRALVARCRAVTFCNPAHAEDFAVPPGRRRELPYPVDVAFWRASPGRDEAFWTSRGLEVPAGPVVAVVANLLARKGQVEVVTALLPLLAVRPEVRVVVAGGTFEPVVEASLRRLAAAARPGQVVLPGALSQVDCRALYAWSAVAVVNSSFETQCMALYESLATGTPTLVRDYDVLTRAFPALRAHSSADGLRSHVEAVLADPASADAPVCASQAQVDRADVARHDALLLAHVEDLVAAGSSRRAGRGPR